MRDTKYGGMFNGCKQTNEEHERFVRKNQELAMADQPVVSRSDRGRSETERTCLNCGIKKNCPKFKKSVAVHQGVASIGGDSSIEHQACDKWKERQTSSDPKKVKLLMREFSRQMR